MSTSDNPATAPVPPASEPRNGFGITALVLGIGGLIVALIPLFGFLGLLAGVIGLVFTGLAFGRVRRGAATKGITIAGGVLSAGALALGIVGLVIVGNAFNQLDQDLRDIGAAAPVVPPDPAAAEGGGPYTLAPTPTQPAELTASFGEQQTRGTLTVTAEEPRTVSGSLGDQLCSTVTLTNNGTSVERFNTYDWNVITGEGVQTGINVPYSTDGSALSSGQLRPDGTVSGDVCTNETEVRAFAYAPLGLGPDLVWR